MKKTTEKHLAIFREECEHWIKRLGLGGWEVNYFTCEEEGIHAKVHTDYGGCTATAFLAKKWDDKITPLSEETIRQAARHEMIHLLLGNFSLLASSRYVSEGELEKAEEELVMKLEKIIIFGTVWPMKSQ